MCVRIIVDSSTDVSEKYREKIQFVPLTVRFGDKEYLDGVELSKHQFYEMLVESDVLPTTSQATPAAFAEYLESVASAGDSAVVITLSSKLSGTYQSAVLAAEDYPNIYVVDSQSVAIGTGVLAQYAVELAQQGMGAEEIAQVLTQQREKVCVVALLDTLEYLKKGGRISKTVAFAGGVLNIKPVVTVQDGAVALIGKARGSRNGNNLLVEKIREAGGVDFERPVLLGYTGLSSALLEKYVDDSKALWADHVDKLDGCLLCSVIGTHAGPGAVAVAFFRKG
ncbi:MAG: DegV family protein [Candidatus Faecousia sp.]|nr:DegV family protein [Eubacteriales bacterium]MDY6067701.1 DegV family protein [Candidatus Faecousia sp.]